MNTSFSSSLLTLPILAGALLAVGSTTARATPPDAKVTVPVGVDLAPYVGTSSALPCARRVVSLNLVGGLAGGIDAFELGGAFNLDSGAVRGLQLAGAFNVVGGPVSGAQIAGALNVVDGPVHGGQLAGALNVVNGPVRGAQIAGALNVADDDVVGLQLAGALNVASDRVKGAQIGTINVAGGAVDGLQLGVVNVAPSAKVGLGLLNIYWDGWAEADVAISETSLLLAGVRHGSGNLYNVYYAGSRLDRLSDLAVGFGIGGRWMLTPDVELSFDVTTISTARDGRFDRLHTQFSLRPQIAWRVVDALALWVGPTLNVLSTEYGDEDLGLPSIATRLSSKGEDVQVWMWPGFAAGVRLF